MIMEKKLVIDELNRGKEMASRLKNNLIKHPSSSSSQEENRFLISQVICSYEKAIFLLNSGGIPVEQPKGYVVFKPRSDGFSEADSKTSSKKRKISEKKTIEPVKIRVGAEEEGSCLDDGYCWRKYGQKEILGSKNPRGYYRCTHRFSQGCLAVKQVQRSDTDPSIYEIKYLGSHTCNSTPIPTTNPTSEEHRVTEQTKFTNSETFEDCKTTNLGDLMLNLDELDTKKAIFRTFSFPKTELEHAGGKNDEIFLENPMETIISPATSGSGVTCELMSAQTSAANSPIGDNYFSSFDDIIDLDTSFSFDSFLELQP